MSTQVEFRPPVKLLDEAVWQAWLEKGRAQDARSRAARAKAVKWVSIAALLAAAGFWPHPSPYDVMVRFIVAGGALVVMFHAIHAKQYIFAAVCAALALLYNPVVPVFSFSGGWQRAVVLASAVPFVVSLAARNLRSA
jgi:hypothetical protein